MTVLDTFSCFGDGECWPPGFRFQPTDEELVLYYLKRKICRRRLKMDVIGETDVYKWEPEDLPGQSKLKTGERQWFFFSPRDRKYPNGARSNRATRQGYWKVTGKDRTVTCNSHAVGVKKTLVFYKGRAPTGKRTDWVMHEYTLDEEELKRCQAALDYYAVYKVYKKSGPGPKNGEQYGAPFREEDWADDENVDNNVCGDQDVQEVNNITLVEDANIGGEMQFPINDLEELMKGLADDPRSVQPIDAVDYALLDALDEEETNCLLVDQPLRDDNLCERSAVLQSGDHNGFQGSFGLTQSIASHLQFCDTSEVTSAPNAYNQETRAPVEDFLEDFLEMNDLIYPVSSFHEVENPVQNLQFEDFDGLSELDLCQDAAFFLRDMGPITNELVSHSCFNEVNGEIVASVSGSCMNNLANEVANPVSHSDNLESEIAGPGPHSCFDNFDNQIVNPSDLSFDYQLHTDSGDANLIGSQLWMHDQRFAVVTPTESNLRTIPPPVSGVVYDGNSGNLSSIADQNESRGEDVARDSWSSALWALVESIPTTPASAAESAFVNKAFQRMSSFGRVKTSAGSTNFPAGKPSATLERSSSSRYNGAFLIFSVLGVACAVLWLLIGTSVRILDGYVI